MAFGKHLYKSRILMGAKRYGINFAHRRLTFSGHMASTAVISQWLIMLENQVFKNNIDMAEVIQRAINHNAIQVYTSEVSYQAKHATNNMYKEYKKACENTFKEKVYPNIPKSWLPEYTRFILNPKDDSKEGLILQAADTIDCIFEAIQEIKLGNTESFVDILDLKLNSLMNFDFKSVKFFFKYCLPRYRIDIEKYYNRDIREFINSIEFEDNLNIENYISFSSYIYNFRILMDTMRYQNQFMFKKRSVADHTWSVAIIAQGLAMWEMKKFGNTIDMNTLLLKCITHDYIEHISGDINGPIKNSTPTMRKAVDDMELKSFNSIAGEIPKIFREDLSNYILYAKDDTIEGKILKAADKIDTILEAAEEIKLNNTEYFLNVLVDSTEYLIGIDLNSVRYFMKFALNDFGLDVKTYYGKKVYNYIKDIEFDDSVFQ